MYNSWYRTFINSTIRLLSKWTVFLLVVSVCLLPNLKSYGFQKDVDEVKLCYNRYISSVTARNGTEAIKYVSKNIIAYYHHILEQSLHADSITISTLRLVDKICILLIRAEIDRAELKKMNAESLFIHSVNSGLVGDDIRSLALGTIEVQGTAATAYVIYNGMKTPYKFQFYMEENRWVFDIGSTLKIAQNAFNELIRESEMTEDQYIMFLIGELKGEIPNNSIWHPLD